MTEKSDRKIRQKHSGQKLKTVDEKKNHLNATSDRFCCVSMPKKNFPHPKCF